MVTQEQTAKAKIRALAQGVRVWALEPGRRYAVPSSSNDGTAYEVVVQSQEPGDITCTCPGAAHRSICKHIGALLVRLDVERELAQVQVVDLGQVQVNEDRELEDKLSDLYS